MSRNHTKRNTNPTNTTEAAAEHTTFQQALAESGETIEELQAPADEAPAKKERKVGTSNLATTISRFRHTYQPAIGLGGKATANNGDFVAKALLLVPLVELRAFVLVAFGKDYSERNPGHERMCAGNVVRAAAKKGDTRVLTQLAIWATPAASEDDSAE